MPSTTASMSSWSSPTGGGDSKNNSSGVEQTPKYHALIIDSGAIIKQTSLGSTNSLLSSAKHYVTVPAVLSEIRDAKSRKHLEEFQLRLQSLHDTKLETRTPSQDSVKAMSEFARKTGDYSQLSGVDLQVLALLYDMEVEAANVYNNGKLDHVRKEPKRVLGINVKAMNGDGKREVKVRGRDRGDSVSGGSIAGSSVVSGNTNSLMSNTAFFHGNADGIIDAAHVDLVYDEHDNGDRYIVDAAYAAADEERDDSVSAAPLKPKSWAGLVNSEKASTAPFLDYSLPEQKEEKKSQEEETFDLDTTAAAPPAAAVTDGQFDDASESEDDAFSNASDSEDELDAMNIANAQSDDEMSDEECDVFVLEPHEAVYFKKLKEEKAQKDLVKKMEHQTLSNEEATEDDAGGLEAEFPSLSSAAAVPYDGSDDEAPKELADEAKTAESQLAWEKEEEERKKNSLLPMVNGRAVRTEKKLPYSSFKKYKNVVSSSGAAVAMKKQKEEEEEQSKLKESEAVPEASNGDVNEDTKEDNADTNQEYKSRILGSAAAGLASSSGDAPAHMTAEDDDGEGWVTCTRDIQNMKATGSLHLHSSRNNNKGKGPRKDVGPPISQRAACATTDFAMQNVILQMNLELLSVDGVRVRRLKTWVTRCGACYTIYGNDDKKSKGGGRLFCDKCGSNSLQRIAASVDRSSGRLKLHMRKNYQYNTRGTKFALPKAGTNNKYQGDLLLAEDQLMYGAWNQKVRKGKSKNAGQSAFGSDLASDLGCVTDLTKRDDIRVGFGRRNPNSTKFGRERRGKKKKGTQDKACGLRRY